MIGAISIFRLECRGGESSDTDQRVLVYLSISRPPQLVRSSRKSLTAGRSVFYRLALLDDSGGELFVPVDKVQSIGIRPLLNRSDIPKLLDLLKEPSEADKDWKQRADDNFKLLTSGSTFDLAEVVKSLTKLGEKRELSFREPNAGEGEKALGRRDL